MLTIKERQRPFSHRPGVRTFVPGTDLEVIAYPAKVIIADKEYPLPAHGPVKQFTLMLDCERSSLLLFSEQYRYAITAEGVLSEERAPLRPLERLFLGSTKSQDWEKMRKRGDMREIAPLWFQLGQQVEAQGRFPLLEQCQEAIHCHRPEKIVPAFHKLFLVGFGELMRPRSFDEEYQGISEEKVEGHPLVLLSEGARLWRSCFLDGNAVLPNLPPQFPSGKLITKGIDIEWTKKQVRRVFVRQKEEPQLRFPSSIKRYRVTKKGEMLYLLDRFEK